MKPKSLGTSAIKGGDIRRHFPVKIFDRKLKLIENFVDKLKENEGSPEVVNFVENNLKLSKNTFSKGAEPSEQTQPDKTICKGMAKNVPSNRIAQQEDPDCVSQMGANKFQRNCVSKWGATNLE